MPKTIKKKHGQSIRVQVYVPYDMYCQLKTFAPPYDAKWESALFKRILHEWMDTQKKKK